MYLSDITRYFSPSASRIEAQPNKLMRIAGWTTNGFWAIQKDFEPDLLKKVNNLKEVGNPEALLKQLKKIIQGYDEAKKSQLEIHNNFIFQGSNPLVMLKNGKLTTWINAYFLSLFGKTTLANFNFYQAGKDKTVYVALDDTVIGIIMPVRV